MPFSTALRAPLAAALLRLRHLLPLPHPMPAQLLQPQQHLAQSLPQQQLAQSLQQMRVARGQREILALAQLAALLPLDAKERTLLVGQTLQALQRVSKPSPKNSASRAQTVRSTRSRQRRR